MTLSCKLIFYQKLQYRTTPAAKLRILCYLPEAVKDDTERVSSFKISIQHPTATVRYESF